MMRLHCRSASVKVQSMGDGRVTDEAVRTKKADSSSRAEISANLLGTFSRISEAPTEYEKVMQVCVLGLNISLDF